MKHNFHNQSIIKFKIKKAFFIIKPPIQIDQTISLNQSEKSLQ